jgi:phage baseplate assembly protein W
MTQRAYRDLRCGDDLDPSGRDAQPLEVFAQDLYHMLITNKMTLLRAPDWGFGLESYLGKPLPSTLAFDIESAVRRDDRANDARCTITPVAGQADTYRLDLQVETDDGFLQMALRMTPDGVVRVS